MLNRSLSIAALAVTLAACSSIGQLTVKEYNSNAGQRVMAGQVEPKSAYNCQKVAQEAEEWGFKGNMDKAAAVQRVTAIAVEKAPVRSANYAHVMIPSESSVMGFNVNAFKDTQVAYYKCANLPASGA